VIVYTACNEAYIPGAIALFNSFRQFNDGRFVVLYDGDDPRKLTERGIEVIVRPTVDLPVIPVTDNRPEETAEVHCFRFAIPELTDGDRAIYIDADALVVKDLTPLWEIDFDRPIAATVSNSPLPKELACTDFSLPRKTRYLAIPNEHGFISSFIIFNIPEWKAQGVMKRCQHVVEHAPLHFKTGDQALLNWVLYRDWHKLPPATQMHVGQVEAYRLPQDQVYIKHFLGTNPWDEIPEHLQPYPGFKLKAREEWRRYFDLRMDV
jgi:hypothetical protein